MKRILAAIAILAFLSPVLSRARQDPTQGTPEAKAEYDKGEVARKKGDFKAAGENFRRAIELDPDYIEAHVRYIFVTEDAASSDVRGAVFSGKATPEQHAKFKKEREQADAQLLAEYQKWAAAHPEKAGYQWALGDLNEYRDPQAAIRYYQAALRIDPKFAPAYQSLSLMEEVQGNLEASREDLRKAAEADPDDPSYLFYYANAFRHSDLAEFTRLSLDILNRFPDSGRAAQALYWLAEAAPSENQKLQYLVRLHDDHAPAAMDWKGSGMEMLFDIYMRTDRAKALELAHEMAKADPDDSWWSSLASYAQAMADADQLVKQGKAAEAVAALDKVSLPKWYHTQQLLRMRAKALAAGGQTKDAYDTLLKDYAATPTDETHSLLVQYGQDLGKDAKQVDAEVWSAREKGSRPAVAFSLPSYTSNEKMSLDEFRGHVILLNFWYPLCGPCRGEFPYIQAVLDKYKNQGFEIVAVNVQPEEDNFVLPLLKGFKLGFLPLKGSDEWATEAYKVRGEPTNFLIGADGRIYFDNMRPVTSPEAQRTLELQVEALLEHAKG